MENSLEHANTFLQDLAIIMLVAGVITVIFHRLRQPVVLGYILAGLILGPHTPPMDQELLGTEHLFLQARGGTITFDPEHGVAMNALKSRAHDRSSTNA